MIKNGLTLPTPDMHEVLDSERDRYRLPVHGFYHFFADINP
jgi:hypothetical protein